MARWPVASVRLNLGLKIFNLFAFGGLLLLSGCGSLGGIVGGTAAGVIGTTILGARSPSHEIQQVYYLGVFDPQEQVPPSIYRITVHGQSSILNSTNYASGWVPASLIDTLGTKIEFQSENGKLQIESSDSKLKESLNIGRRLVLFGPEGFREAPKGHRLVIVMAADPREYFQAVQGVLGAVAEAKRQASQKPELQRKRILESLVMIDEEQERIARIKELSK